MRHDDIKFSWQTRLLMGILVACCLPFFLLIILSLVPLNPITVHSVTISDKTLKAGDPIYYTTSFTKHISKPARVLRQLNNERVTYYTPFDSNMPMGKHCRQNFVETSAGDIPGKYKLQLTFIYEYFFFRDVVVVKESNEFVMLPNPMRGPQGPKGSKGDKGDRGGFFR